MMDPYEIMEARAARRSCGPCYECCVAPGIDELRKWPGQPCRHLDGATHPDRRCSIYANRPTACSRFQCGWLQGLVESDDHRPDKSGLLVSPYPDDNDPTKIHVTIFTRPTYSKDALYNVIRNLFATLPISMIIVTLQKGKAIVFSDGYIRKGQLLKSDTYEGLTAFTEDPPIGNYLLKEG